MKRKVAQIAIRDENARAMWGRCRHEIFRDRKKYCRKKKHRFAEEWD